MSCPYCKNKAGNRHFIYSNDDDDDYGVDAEIVCNSTDVRFSGNAPLLSVSAWYDGAISIGPEFAPINFCPMCGRSLTER